MSLFGRLFGRETAAELEAKAEEAAGTGQFGTAKLTFERVLEKDPDEATRTRVAARIDAMRDAIARSRLDEAERLLAASSVAEARAEVVGAAEVAVDPAIVDRARTLLESIDHAATMRGATAPTVRTTAELVAAVTSGWNDDQAEEFEALGEPLLVALVAMERGEFAAARASLEPIVTAAESPRWLHRELARARWADGDAEGADRAFTDYFEAVVGDAFDRELFESRLDRARLLDELGRREDALLEVELSLEHVGDSPRAFVAAARMLREYDHAEDAKEVLDAALGLDGATSDRALQVEYAFVEAKLGRSEEALVRLERIALDERQRGYEPPRDLEGARATLLARVGRKEHAADLFRRLALESSDALAFEHAVASAVLHAELGHRGESTRLFDRADRIAPGDELRSELAKKRAEILGT